MSVSGGSTVVFSGCSIEYMMSDINKSNLMTVLFDTFKQ